jgi:hypothetical protein
VPAIPLPDAQRGQPRLADRGDPVGEHAAAFRLQKAVRQPGIVIFARD